MRERTSQQRGGVLVLVLALILVAGALVTGWLTVMTAEIDYVAQISEGTQRRIGRANATAMARQYLLDNLLTKNGSSAASGDVGGGWGSVVIPASSGTPLSTFQSADGYNHFNPGNGAGYTEDVTVTMTTGTDPETTLRRLRLKSRSTLLSGTVAVMNAPGSSLTGSVTVNTGQMALLWQPGSSYSIATASYAVPGRVTASSSLADVLCRNFPFVPLTGSEVAGVPSFAGGLDVIANTSGINSLAVMANTSAPNGLQTVNGGVISTSNGVESDGGGTVRINLLSSMLGNVIVRGGTTHLILTGQTTAADKISAGNEAAILILVYQTAPATNLIDVTFENANNRKVVFAIKKPSGLGTGFSFPQAASGSWRSLLVLENTPVTFDMGGSGGSLVGGIQSNSAITVVSGVLNLFAEPDPKLLERLSARDGWIEVYTMDL